MLEDISQGFQGAKSSDEDDVFDVIEAPMKQTKLPNYVDLLPHFEALDVAVESLGDSEASRALRTFRDRFLCHCVPHKQQTSLHEFFKVKD